MFLRSDQLDRFLRSSSSFTFSSSFLSCKSSLSLSLSLRTPKSPLRRYSHERCSRGALSGVRRRSMIRGSSLDSRRCELFTTRKVSARTRSAKLETTTKSDRQIGTAARNRRSCQMIIFRNAGVPDRARAHAASDPANTHSRSRARENPRNNPIYCSCGARIRYSSKNRSRNKFRN